MGPSPSGRTFSAPDPLAVTLMALAAAGCAALFMLVLWNAALAALLAVILVALAVQAAAHRRGTRPGRAAAGAALALVVFVLLAEELSFAALGAGWLSAGDDHPFYVPLWGNRGRSRIEQTLHGGDTAARRWAAEALAPYGRAAVPAWQSGMKDPDAAVRRLCAERLADFPDPSSEAVLLAAAHDPDGEVQVKAAAGLGATAGAESCRAMAKSAGAALRRMRDPYATHSQMGRPAAPDGSGAALRELVLHRHDLVLRCLSDSDADVRLGMLSSLSPNGATAMIATPHAVQLVQQLDRDRDPEVRASAVQMLGELTRTALRHPPGAAPYGVDPAWMSDPSTKGAAVDADGVLNDLVGQLAGEERNSASPALAAIYLVLNDLPPTGSSPQVPAPAPVVHPETYARIFDAVWNGASSGRPDHQSCNILSKIYANRAGTLLFASKLGVGPKTWRLRAANFLYCIGDPAALPALRQADAHWVSSDEDYCPVCNSRHCAFCNAIHRLDPSAHVPHPIPQLGPNSPPHEIPTILRQASK